MEDKDVQEHNGVKYHEYCYPSPMFIHSECKQLKEIIGKVCRLLKLDIDSIFVNKNIYAAYYRVDQRKVHYKMYRQGMTLGEINEAAILCYWIIRYRPIRFKDGSFDAINEIVAYYMLIFAVCGASQKKLSDFSSITADILYAFMNRNMTYDTMTLLAKAMAI
jgi:hypothetical protein